jgi:hypothetical protein
MVFHEITKEAIQRALENTRDIDTALVDAQETRRILDRLYGFEISPVLWRKVGPGLSAGRVQSAATRLVVDRERERLAFVSAVYWDLTAELGADKETFQARLARLDGKRVASGRDYDDRGQLSGDVVALDETGAEALADALRRPSTEFTVSNLDTKPYTRRPAAPFTTSTLQQVNLTDGLDGLAIGPVIISAFSFMFLAYATGAVLSGFNVAEYLGMPHIEGAGELAVFCGAIGGAGIGFLWFNTHPAQVFMGDVGALALGGALGYVALATKTELSLPIIGGLFIVELMSDIIQVGYYKRTKRRVFLMAPIHHHFEKKGWPESRIVVRFWIVSFCFAIAGLLLTLKVR